MKKCPYCAEEIQDEAIKCRFCGSMLDGSEGMVPAGGTPLPAAPGDEEALQFTHSGSRYLLGYGRSFFGIWDRQGGGGPISRFPRTDDGWQDAWTSFSTMEPTSAEVGIGSSLTPAGSNVAQLLGPGSSPASRGAVACLTLGILGLFLGPLAIVALVVGYKARRQINQGTANPSSTVLVTAGIVLGWVGLALWIISIALLTSGLVDAPFS